MNVLARMGIAMLLGLTLPLWYFLGASAGLVPWFGILLISFLPAFRLGYFALALNVCQLLIYALWLYVLAHVAHRMITSFERTVSRRAAAVVFVAAALGMGGLPLYSVSHAAAPHRASAFALYVAIWSGHVL